MTDSKPIPFDSQAPWSTAGLETGYDLRIEPAGDTPKASIVIEPDNATLDYYFIQSFDDKAAFTPGYAIADAPLTNQLLDTGVYSVPDEIPVETWMPAAIERAGFVYDPEPNTEKRTHEREPTTHPDQKALTEL